MVKSGWFRESYRHYLASKGVSTYRARRGSKSVRELEIMGAREAARGETLG
jgi:hypothetical protein